jgi:site-specific recombinase XerD
VVEYLKHGRPPCTARQLFIRERAPHTGMLCSGAIRKIVDGALRRADLYPPHRGPHMLRHSFATRLLRRGASLPEIGRMLGHERQSSTMVYAHADLGGLKPVAQPWRGGAL